jgi:hypothetical protein
MKIAITVIGLAAALALAGCGGDEQPADNAVDAQEQNAVEVAGVRYRVVLFRQLNVHTKPDDALWDGASPSGRKGLYMAVLRACAAEGKPARATTDIHLEDAFGAAYQPRVDKTAETFRYTGGRLAAGECLPDPDSVADRVLDGAALVFEVPFKSTRDRPLVLEIDAPGSERGARIQVDL